MLRRDSSWDDEGLLPTGKGSSLRDTSPFAIAVGKRSKNKMVGMSHGTDGSSNDLHHPDLGKYLESHMFPLAPLWSGMMLGKCETLSSQVVLLGKKWLSFL